MKELIDFMFKCIDLHGNDASVLFGLIPFSKFEDYFLYKLFNQFFDTVDFCFLAKEHIQYVFKRNEKFLWDDNYIRTFQSTTIFVETM